MKSALLVLGFCLYSVVFQSATLLAQGDDTPAVLKVYPEKNHTYQVRLAAFNPDYVWLGNQVFHLPSQRLLPVDSSFASQPANSQLVRRGSDPRWPSYMWWEADPYDDRYCWGREHWEDTLVLWRYDRKKSRQDCWHFNFRATELVFGKPGIWVSDNSELMLIDRHNGAVRNRAAKPVEGYVMHLQPWGDDVVVTEKWIYQREKNTFIDFFPLPTDLKNCREPDRKEVHPELCVSRAYNSSSKLEYFLLSPGHPPVKLPFAVGDCSWNFLLGANPPQAWFCMPDKIAMVDAHSGDSVLYAGKLGLPLPFEQQNGRFLGFQSEQGLTFFDKTTCQFRVLDMPYGFRPPISFISDKRFIYLQFEDHWEILNFPKLNTAFKHSVVLEEFQHFEKDLQGLLTNMATGFYTRYADYSRLLEKYRNTDNPKIAAQWNRATGGLSDALFQAPDTLMQKVAVDYFAGRFDPSVNCVLVEALFDYWKDNNEIYAALNLLDISGNAICLENSNYGEYFALVMRGIAHSIDSIETLQLGPDERLYALGRVWMDFCLLKGADGYSATPFKCLETAFAYYDTLTKQYPNSPWADNATYDRFHYIDYQPSTTDDFTPPGNDREAFVLFERFLQDYPGSDRRPDVLLRMASIVLRGTHGQNIDKSLAVTYLQTIADEYPDFARSSEKYRRTRDYINQQLWSKTWGISMSFDKQIYSLSDTIRVTVRIQNKSGIIQRLEDSFLQHWHEGLKLSLSEVRDATCVGLWGDFPVVPQITGAKDKAVTVPAGAWYEESFVVRHRSANKNFSGGSFGLERGKTYSCHLEFRHDQLTWLWGSAQKDVQFKVE